MSPTRGVGGQIVLSADPVGVGVGVASGLHSISLMNFGQTYTNLSLGGGKNLIIF